MKARRSKVSSMPEFLEKPVQLHSIQSRQRDELKTKINKIKAENSSMILKKRKNNIHCEQAQPLNPSSCPPTRRAHAVRWRVRVIVEAECDDDANLTWLVRALVTHKSKHESGRTLEQTSPRDRR